jgi:hypothetical protein
MAPRGRAEAGLAEGYVNRKDTMRRLLVVATALLVVLTA